MENIYENELACKISAQNNDLIKSYDILKFWAVKHPFRVNRQNMSEL